MNALRNKEGVVLSRLGLVDCKTGGSFVRGGPICRSWASGRARILGAENTDACYHVMSRTTGGDRLFDAEDKEALRRTMRKMAVFTGVKLLTWCILDNHFHVLIRVPNRGKYLRRFDDKEGEEKGAGEDRLMTHLSTLYSKAYMLKLRGELAWMRERGMEADVEKFLEKYRRRFCDLSIYVKEVKERFSRWFNRKYDRKGTLWMSRFKSVLVEDGEALRTMSAYIDLNSVRAGIVADPKDYRWCGYAEAVAGSKQARRGLCWVMGKPLDSWAKHGSWYRCWLMIDGEEVEESKADHVKARVGIPQEKVKEVLGKGGRLTMSEQLLSRVSYFTEGAAIGSQAFIETVFERNRSKFGPSRKRAAKPIVKSANLNQKAEGERKEVSEDPSAKGDVNICVLQGAIRALKE